MANAKYYWGVDPAWKNLGACVLDEDRNVVWNKTINPSEFGFSKAVDQLPFLEYPPSNITIERYVAYGGVTSKYSEHTLMMIGAILDRSRDSQQYFFRAIDWKTLLMKKARIESGFENPSKKLDKKFSLALALHLTGVKFKTDHEADAACLAYIGTLGLAGKVYEDG